MAHYLNQLAEGIDVFNVTHVYCHKPDVLFEDEKTNLKVWIDIEIGDKKYENLTSSRMSSRMTVSTGGNARMDDLLINIGDDNAV